MKKTEKLPRKNYGKYRALHHPGGGATIWGPGLRERGAYIPSDATILAHYQADKTWTSQSESFLTWIGLRGILEEPHRRSVPKGREALGISHPVNNRVERDEIERAIKKFWSEENVARFFEGDFSALRSINEFAQKHTREYHSAHRARVHGGFKKILDEIYPELYAHLLRQVDASEVDKEKVAEILSRRYAAGLPVSNNELRFSSDRNERRLARQVSALAGRGLFKDRTYTETVAKLIGVTPRDISPGRGARKDHGILTEGLTQFLCTWAPLVDVNLEGKLGTEMVYGNGERSRVRARDEPEQIDGKEGWHADLRLGNQLVEVKASGGYFSPSDAEKLVKRYGSKIIWNDSEEISSRAVVFFMRPEIYKNAITLLKNARISPITFKWIHEKLAEVVEKINERYPEVVDAASPRMHSVDFLLRLSEGIAYRPSVILREGNESERVWAKEVLNYLIQTGRALREGKKFAETEREEIDSVVGGEVRTTEHGRFLHVSHTLDRMEQNALVGYVRENAGVLTTENIKKNFGLPDFVKKRAGFFDIESRGLSASSQIISFSITYLNEDFKTECFVARDPSEERAALAAAFEALHGIEVGATFNGSSYDLPKLTNRGIQQGLFTNGFGSWQNFFGERHVDLYSALRARRLRHDCRLGTFEKLIVGYNREGDISGARIPEVYDRYCAGENNAFDVARIVRHNMLDTVSNAAVMIFLCKR